LHQLYGFCTDATGGSWVAWSHPFLWWLKWLASTLWLMFKYQGSKLGTLKPQVFALAEAAGINHMAYLCSSITVKVA